MAKFRVTISRVTSDGRRHNPFAKIHISIHDTIPMICRTWEFEAKDEDDVRRLFKEAQDANLPNVRGFNLDKVERLDGDRTP